MKKRKDVSTPLLLSSPLISSFLLSSHLSPDSPVFFLKLETQYLSSSSWDVAGASQAMEEGGSECDQGWERPVLLVPEGQLGEKN